MKLRKDEFNLILKNGESYHVEFKAGFNKSFAREVTAFANASGGRIFLGVTDTGKPTGITITNALKSQMQDTAHNCQPPVDISIEEIDNILIVTVPEGKNKPYQCSDGFFIRMGSNAQKMDRDRIIEFIQNEGHVRFEEQPHGRIPILWPLFVND